MLALLPLKCSIAFCTVSKKHIYDYICQFDGKKKAWIQDQHTFTFFPPSYFLLSSPHSPSCSWALTATALSTSLYGRTSSFHEVMFAWPIYLGYDGLYLFTQKDCYGIFLSASVHIKVSISLRKMMLNVFE